MDLGRRAHTVVLHFTNGEVTVNNLAAAAAKLSIDMTRTLTAIDVTAGDDTTVHTVDLNQCQNANGTPTPSNNGNGNGNHAGMVTVPAAEGAALEAIAAALIELGLAARTAVTRRRHASLET